MTDDAAGLKRRRVDDDDADGEVDGVGAAGAGAGAGGSSASSAAGAGAGSSSAKSGKRASDAIAADAGRILAKVRDMVTKMKKEAMTAEKPKTLAELGIVNVTEVRESSTDDVLDEIEKALLSIASTILAGEGFSYDVPTRNSSNVQYIPELDRIVLQVRFGGHSDCTRQHASTPPCCRSAAASSSMLSWSPPVCLQSKTSQRPFTNVSSVRKATIMTRVMQLIFDVLRKASDVPWYPRPWSVTAPLPVLLRLLGTTPTAGGITLIGLRLTRHRCTPTPSPRGFTFSSHSHHHIGANPPHPRPIPFTDNYSPAGCLAVCRAST